MSTPQEPTPAELADMIRDLTATVEAGFNTSAEHHAEVMDTLDEVLFQQTVTDAGVSALIVMTAALVRHRHRHTHRIPGDGRTGREERAS